MCVVVHVVVMSVRVCMCVVVSEIVVVFQSFYRIACTSMILAINCTLGKGKGWEELPENMLAVATDDSWFPCMFCANHRAGHTFVIEQVS